MFLSDLSIKQPVFATMMMVALAVLGLNSYRALQVDLFPEVEFPVVTVTTRYAGRVARDRRARRHEDGRRSRQHG